AAAEGVDFAQLFTGLSFFLVAAAVLLTALLFAFTAEQRAEETGTLLAVGFTRAQARRLLLAEGALLALVAAPPGAAAGVLYNVAIVRALRRCGLPLSAAAGCR
ncbi:MAG: FtsX-like permease family protein, partial [Planctomycetota bacterium]